MPKAKVNAEQIRTYQRNFFTYRIQAGPDAVPVENMATAVFITAMNEIGKRYHPANPEHSLWGDVADEIAFLFAKYGPWAESRQSWSLIADLDSDYVRQAAIKHAELNFKMGNKWGACAY